MSNEETRNEEFRIDKDTALALLFGAIIVLSAVQFLQLNAVSDALDVQQLQLQDVKARASAFSASAVAGAAPMAAATGNPAAGNAVLPSNLQNLPDMVGGC